MNCPILFFTCVKLNIYTWYGIYACMVHTLSCIVIPPFSVSFHFEEQMS